MRKAAVSIPSNVAEGQGRETTPDYRRFVISARGSLLELETQMEICERLGYFDRPVAEMLRARTKSIGQGLNALLRYLAGHRTPDT